MRAQAERSNYDASPEDILSDMLVCGVNNDTIKQRNLCGYQFALELATILEEATKGTDCTISPAVEGLDPEKIGIEVNLVSKEAEIFVE